MGILDSLKDGGAQSLGTAQAAEHFDQVAQTAPRGMIAEGLAAAFRSNQTPSFGNLVGTLFSHSNGEQKAGILSHLIGSAAPGILSQLGGGVLTRLQGTGEQQVSPDQAQTISPEVVQQLATHAEQNDPSIVEKASAFYAQHSTLVKTLGGAVLTMALAKVAERQRAA
jgi:hypothetical protein